ncbi:hypothetical protein H0H87_001116 [Tephrocybe sp. NHM501043]|nr:hypothetical protein H0H87_001116 [Tephrocybe sp. NHM501043]
MCALDAERPATIVHFMAGVNLTITDDVIFMYLSDVPSLTGFLNSILCIADHFLAQSNHAFKNWCVLGDSISKILKDWKAAWEKKREKERLKERELEYCAMQASKEQPSKCRAYNTTSPKATLGDLPVLKKLKIGSFLELLLDIECFLEGQELLKELDVEELFATLDKACLLETLHLDIAFWITQALLLCCEHLFQFMDHDIAQTSTQLPAL